MAETAAYIWQQMHLRRLKLENMKNYDKADVTLLPQVNCFTGANGSGKTNLLDAVYYLSFTKSFFNASDQQNINHHRNMMALEGIYMRDALEETVRIVVQRGGRKIVKVNNNEPNKLSEHIGSYPLVMITPNDIMLVYEGSEERRKFMDGMISQIDKIYLNELLLYNRILDQRNKQLKQFAETGFFDSLLLETYNVQLIKSGTLIHEIRQQFLESFIPVFRQLYGEISSTSETVDIVYDSVLNEQSFESIISQSEPHDLAACRTTKGIHKDELDFLIADYPLKKCGSQGQQKTFIIALKLAQYAYLKEKAGVRPILLLDDVFEKLDAMRLNKLLSMISADEFGQIMITDTHIERLQAVFNNMQHINVKYFTVDKGIISEL